MKLQYLGDVRDAFKWDLLHWICTRAEPRFSRLLFVPLLTPDDPIPRDGRISHVRFQCRPEIRSIVHALAGKPRSFETLRALGRMEPGREFEVVLYRPDLQVSVGPARNAYWDGIESYLKPDNLIFLDPDNGFETKTRNAAKWVRHREVRELLSHVPSAGGVAIYQHRPQRRPWTEVFEALSGQLDYTSYAAAVYEANLSFVVLTKTNEAHGRLDDALRSYVGGHPMVRFIRLRGTGA
jgi:hypothetical protein